MFRALGFPQGKKRYLRSITRWIMQYTHNHLAKSTARNGAIVVLGVILLVAVFAFVAFTVDLGHMALVRAELQSAADAAALGSAMDIPHGEAITRAAAKDLAMRHTSAGSTVTLDDADIDLGYFDFDSKIFVADPVNANAVRVVARAEDERLFFAPIMGTSSFDQQATAIGMLSPRDIVFVVDLSGSMNDDTEPCWATDALQSRYTPLGYPTVAADLMQDVFTDFGFGSYPGTTEYFGSVLGVAEDDYAYAEITKDDGPLTSSALSAYYRIDNADAENVRKLKAYRWVIDHQIARMMPAAKPAPDSTVNYDYWSKYLDYLCDTARVGEPPPPDDDDDDDDGGGSTPPPSGPTPPPAVGRFKQPGFKQPGRDSVARWLAMASLVHPEWVNVTSGLVAAKQSSYRGCPRRGANEYLLLPSADRDRVTGFNNPNGVSFPTASIPYSWRNHIGYVTYVQFMMDWGRERSPQIGNSINADPAIGGKTPLSLLSPDCPLHLESTAGGDFLFPPRSQPMHSVRRALIAAVNLIKERNMAVAAGAGDRVSIITYDGDDAFHEATIVQPLTEDWHEAMKSCAMLQAASDLGATTFTESGLILARRHLLPRTASNNASNDPLGPQGRDFTKKVVVLLTDGMPNVWDMASTDVESYVASNPSGSFYPDGYDWFNSTLVQTHQFQARRGQLFPVGMGLAADFDFMDRMARIASTDIGGQSLRGSGNPAEYEQQLIEMLENVINRSGSKLAQ